MDLLPIYDPQTGKQINQSAVEVPSFLRLANQAPVRPVEQPGVLGGGLAAGWEETMGLVNAASAAAGKLVGADGWAESEAADAQARFAEAQRVGRPDLEVAPWEEGGASFLPWLAYQGAKQIPTTLGMAAAALAASAAAPAVGAGGAIGAGLGVAGRGLASLPAILGGQGLKEGASFAARRAALEAGKATAARVAGAAALGAPLGAGSMYAEAIDRGDPTWADAAKAIGLSPVYGAMEAVLPSKLAKIAEKGATGGIVKRAVTQGMEGLGQEMLTEGMQTALEMSFRPDMTLQEKASQVVNAALTGGAVGGMFGAGAGALRKAKDEDPNALSTEALGKLVEEGLMTPQLPGMQPTRVEAKEQVRRADKGSAFPMYNDEQVVAELTAATQKVMANPNAPMQDVARLNKLKEEVTRRGIDLTPQTTVPLDPVEAQRQTVQGQPNLFGETLPEQLSPALAEQRRMSQPTEQPKVPTQQEIDAERKALNKRAGGRITFIDELLGRDEPDRINVVRQRLEAQDASKTTLRLADAMGLTSPEKREELVAKAKTAIAQSEAAWQRVKLTGEGTAQAKKAQEIAQEAQKAVDNLNEADRRWAARNDPSAAPAASTPVSPAPTPAQTPAGAPATPPVVTTEAPMSQPNLTAQTGGIVEPPAPAPVGPALTDAQQELVASRPLAAAVEGAAPTTQLGEALQQAALARRQQAQQAVTSEQRRAEYDAAEAQRLDARAQAEALKVGVEPVTVRKIIPSGTKAEVQLTSGRVPLVYRTQQDGVAAGWYKQDGTFVSPSINQAAQALRDEAQDDQDGGPIQPMERALDRKVISKQRRRLRETIRYMAGADVADQPQRVTREVLAQAVAEKTANWKGDLDIIVVDKQAELPESVRRSMRGDGVDRVMGMVAKDGKVYLIAENIPTSDMGVAVLFHEALGHKGLEAKFRDALDSVLMDFYRSNTYIRAKTDQWMADNPGAYKGSSNPKARAVEEILAHLSMGGVIEATIWEKLKATVKQFLRQLGLPLTMSNGEVAAILAMAHAKVTKGPGRVVERKANGQKYIFAGEKSLDTMLELQEETQRRIELEHAKQMDAQGNYTSEEIRIATGWFKGRYDKKWRYEILDISAHLDIARLNAQQPDSNPLLLADILQHPRLFEIYPALRSIEVTRKPGFLDFLQTQQGGYVESKKQINITPYAVAPLSTLIHEIQHVIQSIEGFARGSNSKDALKQMRDDQLSDLVQWTLPKVDEAMERSKKRIRGFAAVKSWLRHPLVAEVFALERRIEATRKSESLREQRLRLMAEKTKVMNDLRRAYSGTDDTNAMFSGPTQDFIDVLRDVPADNPEANIDGLIKAETALLEGLEQDRRGLMSNNPAVIRFKLQEHGAGYEAYIRSAGEIEARSVQARMGLTFEQSLMVAPLTRDNDGREYTPEQAGVDLEGGSSWSASALADMREVPQVIQKATEWKNEAVRKADLSGKVSGLRKTMLGWLSMTELARRYDKMFKGALGKLNQAYQFRATVAQKLSQLSLVPYRDFERLDAQDAKDTNYVMEATAQGLDPAKPWDQQNDEVKKDRDADHLRTLHAQYHAAYNRLARKGKLTSYQNFKLNNEAQAYHHQDGVLRRVINADPAIRRAIFGDREAPMQRMMRDERLSSSPAAAAEFWKREVQDTMARVKKFVDEQYGLPNASRSALASQLALALRQVEIAQEGMAKAPYFHLGRFGNYFVAFHVPSVEVNGRKEPDRSKLEAVAKRLEDAGFVGVRINTASDRYNVFIRNESQEANFQLRQLAETMQKEGLLDPTQEVKHGTRNEAFDVTAQDWMLQAIVQIQTSPQFEVTPDMSPEERKRRIAMRDSLVEHMRGVMLDMLPDTSLTKVMTHRESVPGFSRDMVRAQMHRAQMSAISQANFEAEPYITEAVAEARTALEDLKTQNSQDIYEAQAVFEEVQLREQQRHRNEARTWYDTLRAINHVYFLGLSPAYVLINMTQLYVMLWPNLAKKHGFVKAAKTIAKVTPLALRIVMATAKEGFRTSWEAAPDATITSSALDNVKGLDAETRSFVLSAGNTGTLDIGSASREHGRVAEGRADDKLDLALRFGSSMGYYSEMAARLISALAARELEGGKNGEKATLDYAIDMVNSSMFTYSNWNIARHSSKSGVAGPMTPLMMSFMQYTLQLMETLYREGYTAIKGDTPQARKEARRFLGAHLAAMLFFAGQLGGVPMMSMVAALIDNILGDDDEPFDFKTEMRNFYADLFGDDMAEVLTRGVPRAFGIDISQRVGEADILPFTRLLTDKRSWQDAAGDYALNLLGSPVGMVMNLVAGGTEISNGNVFEGMKQMVPVAMKGPLEAMRLSNTGFVDKAGNVLPMSPNAIQIMAQAGGFTPAPMADYREANLAQLQRKGQLTARAANIRKNLLVSIERGDQEAMRDWAAQALAFDQANPAMSVLDDIEASLRRRARARLIAEATNTPIGTNWRDVEAQQFTRYLDMQ